MSAESMNNVALTMLVTASAVSVFWLVVWPMPADTVYWAMEDGERVVYTLPLLLHGGLDRIWLDIFGWSILAGLWHYSNQSHLPQILPRISKEHWKDGHILAPGFDVVAPVPFGIATSGLGSGLLYSLISNLVLTLVLTIRFEYVTRLIMGSLFALVSSTMVVALSIHAVAGFLFLATVLGLAFFSWIIWHGLGSARELIACIRLAPPTES